MKILYQTNPYNQQRQKQKKVWVYPVRLAMEAEFYRDQGHYVDWDPLFPIDHYDKTITEPEGLDFLSLPFPDRIFSMAFDKRYQVYGNYKYHPATHFQVADGCWHGRCTFCVERKKKWKVRSLDHVFEEIGECWHLGFKEMFDDSGTFPDGGYLSNFCDHMITRKPGMVFGCNMRIGGNCDFKQMKAAGFRMILFGIESFNQKTLDRIKKGVDAHDIEIQIKRAADAGLEPHVAIMLGLPGESKAEEFRSIQGVWNLLRKGYAKTAQASVYDVGEERGIPKHPVSAVYGAARYIDFWYQQISSIRSPADAAYFFKKIKKGVAETWKS